MLPRQPGKDSVRPLGASAKESAHFVDKGDEFMRTSKWNQAVEAYKQAISISPKNSDAYVALGEAYNQMGRHGEAFAPLVRAIQLDPQNASAHYGIGYAYLMGDNYEKSIGFFESAIRLEPEYPEALYGIGLAYAKVGEKTGDKIKQQEAVSALDRYLRLASEDDPQKADAERLLTDLKGRP